MPTISVIIPIYNVESYIQQCLESVVTQTFQDIEVLCVNDCSTDNSIQIVKEYAKKDNRIKIVNLEINKGLGAARNFGVKAAKGKYVACIDSDDYVEPDMFELSYNKLEETGFDSVWVNVKTFDDNKQHFSKDNYLREYSEGIINITPENINQFPVNAWNKLYRLNFIKIHNVLWSNGLLYEDIEFYYRFYTKSKTLYFIDRPLYIYRIRNNSILHNDKTGKSNREDIFKVAKNIYIYLNEEKIFDTYKNSFIVMVTQSIERSHNINSVANAAINLLRTINFPDNFEKNDYYDFLEYFIKYSKSSNLKKSFYKCYYIFILFLTKIIPIAKYRKKYRLKYKKYVF